jgi:hypothetical protein
MTQKVRVRRDAMLVDTPIHTDGDGNLFFGIWVPPFDYSPKTSDIQHTITQAEEGRPDLLAYKYYRNVNLFWVILWVNKIHHPLRGLTAGKTIIIPSRDTVNNYMAGV